MALDSNTRKGFDGRELPLALQPDTQLRLHGAHNDRVVAFVEYTGEVALPREGGAVIRFAFVGGGMFDGCTDTAVAGELSLAGRHMHVPSYWSRCSICGEAGVYNID